MYKKIDNLGRFVIPKEIRKIFNITISTPISINYNKDNIIITPIKEKLICKNCNSIINNDDNYCSVCGTKNK